MALKRHMLITNLVLATLEKLGNLIIGFLTGDMPYLSNLRSLGPFHGLEEAHDVHQPSPGHLGEVQQPHHWLPHGQYDLHDKFQILKSDLCASVGIPTED